jgi:hypothetical protein
MMNLERMNWLQGIHQHRHRRQLRRSRLSFRRLNRRQR